MVSPKVIFENNDLFVFDKPSGLVVNLSKTSPENTLQNSLIDDYGLVYNPDSEFEFISRAGIVHRLDKDTSGVIIVAKNKDSFEFLQSQFKERKVHKEYIALVSGRIGDKEIHIDAPIGRDKTNRIRQAIDQDGRESFTKIDVERKY